MSNEAPVPLPSIDDSKARLKYARAREAEADADRAELYLKRGESDDQNQADTDKARLRLLQLECDEKALQNRILERQYLSKGEVSSQLSRLYNLVAGSPGDDSATDLHGFFKKAADDLGVTINGPYDGSTGASP